VKIIKNERDPPLFTGKLLIKFQNILRNTTQVIVRHRICLQTDGHGETSIPPYNFVAGGIMKEILQMPTNTQRHCHCIIFNMLYLRNKSWKPECVLSFNMGWWILVNSSEG
jgi:hypothetical protein